MRIGSDRHPSLRRLFAVALLAPLLTLGAWPLAATAVDYSVIAEQNLFDPHRRPWLESEAAAASASPLTHADLQVQGIVIRGAVKRAIVRLGGRLRAFAPDTAAGRSDVILREGQSLGDYTLESIDARRLVFSTAGRRFTVPLLRNGPRQRVSANAAPLPVIQAPTLPVTAPPTAPAFRPRRVPRPHATPSRPAPMRPAPARPPAAGQGGGTGSSTAVHSPAAPTSGMTLLQAIRAAEAARRAGHAPAPPVNPFAPRPN